MLNGDFERRSLLAGDHGGLAGPLRPRPARCGRRRRHRRRVHGHQRGARAGAARPGRDGPRGGNAGLGRVHPQRRHRPRRVQVERRRAHRAVRRGDRPGAVPGDARLVRAREAAHRRRGHRLRLPRSRPPRARLRAFAWPDSSTRGPASPRSVSARPRARERVREEIGTDAYYGALVVEGSGLLHPGRYFAGLAAAAAGPERTCTKGSGRVDPNEADGRFVVEMSRGAILARDVFVATNGYTDGVAPSLRRRVIPIGSYIIASEPLPEDLVRELSPKGRAFFDTKNSLYFWHVSADRRMVFGGRPRSCPRRSIRPPGSCGAA